MAPTVASIKGTSMNVLPLSSLTMIPSTFPESPIPRNANTCRFCGKLAKMDAERDKQQAERVGKPKTAQESKTPPVKTPTKK
jgi:hypothetical protein